MKDAGETTRTITRTAHDTILIPSVQIEVTSGGDGAVTVRDLGLIPLVIGQGAGCDVIVRDQHVSNQHCEISLSERGIDFRDKGSKNGSFVGPTNILEGVLSAGTTIWIGESRLVIRAKPGAREVPLSPGRSFGRVVGQSLIMRALFASLGKVGERDSPVVLVGERGTGRTLLAAQLYAARSVTKGKWVAVDFLKMKKSRCESALFGYVDLDKGGATVVRPGCLEASGGGAVFLGNVDHLPSELCRGLIEALKTRSVVPVGSTVPRSFDAQVLISIAPHNEETNGLGELVGLRSGIRFDVPPLRDRKEDIPRLVEHFLGERNPPRALSELPPYWQDLFRAHVWPGNVAELQRVVALLLGTRDVSRYLADFSGYNSEPSRLGDILDLPLADARDVVTDHFERAYLIAKLAANQGNVSETARRIGVSRGHLHELLKEHGIKGDDALESGS